MFHASLGVNSISGTKGPLIVVRVCKHLRTSNHVSFFKEFFCELSGDVVCFLGDGKQGGSLKYVVSKSPENEISVFPFDDFGSEGNYLSTVAAVEDFPFTLYGIYDEDTIRNLKHSTRKVFLCTLFRHKINNSPHSVL